ncbi:flagella synthesis protein FlgN [Methylomonas methanica]|uniref:FlgN family protein n=1 Tax=Methylomonas methanica (strain DSM 25384 / MC09) TaxID=857087 RepID=F9ZV24_METMM|nr:flagellar protein FlgN [Methylomonas methanica]AEF99457.1 FlgN family protein [Methylomonas methanica MC09]
MIEKTFPIAEKLLSNGLKLTQKLFELLNAEYEQLKVKKDPATIASLAAHKKDVVAQLEQFSKQLGQVLATEKLLVSQEGIHSYLAKAKASGINIADSHRYWLDIATLTKTCRTLNEKNGASIDLLSRHTQRALQVLRGKSQLATTYGPDGSTRSELFSHTLISV